MADLRGVGRWLARPSAALCPHPPCIRFSLPFQHHLGLSAQLAAGPAQRGAWCRSRVGGSGQGPGPCGVAPPSSRLASAGCYLRPAPLSTSGRDGGWSGHGQPCGRVRGGMSGGGGCPRPAYPRSFPSQLCPDLLSIPASTSASCGACGLFGDRGSWYRLGEGCVAGSSAPPRFVLPSFPTGFSFPDRSASSTQSRWSESRGGGPLGGGGFWS